MPSHITRALPAAAACLKSGLGAWLYMAKLTVPAMALTRLLIWFDLIPYVAMVFRPLMAPLGLPPELALVWVTAIIATNYAAIAVYLSLAPLVGPLAVWQVTLLSCLILLAHGLLVEGQVCRAAGLSFWRANLYRLAMAMVFGFIIRGSAAAFGWGAAPAQALGWLSPEGPAVPGWAQWALGSAQQLLLMLAVIEFLMLVMELVKYCGLTRLISKALGPVLRLVGVGEGAIMVTIIGCVLGLGYGGGLIVAESRSGRVAGRDIFAAIMLMALFHSIVEDTLVIYSLGGTLWWLLVGRLAFALALSALVNRLVARPFWHRLLVGPGLKG